MAKIIYYFYRFKISGVNIKYIRIKMSEDKGEREIIRTSEEEKESKIITISEDKKEHDVKISDEGERNIIKMTEEKEDKIVQMSEEGEISDEDEGTSKVIRIVNLSVTTNEKSLREFITTAARPVGQIEKLFLRKHLRMGVCYAYIVLQFSEDAVKMSDLLNGYKCNHLKLEVELIGPHLPYKIYDKNGTANAHAAVETLLGKRKSEDKMFDRDKIRKKQNTLP